MKFLKFTIILFFGILFNSCNDCTGNPDDSDEDLIYFSANDGESFTTFIFDPNSLFIDSRLNNSIIHGFVNNQLLVLSENKDTIYNYDESTGTKNLIFEKIPNIKIINPVSNNSVNHICFFGDSSTIYQSDLTGNLQVISRDASIYYTPEISSVGISFIFEKVLDNIFIIKKDINGDIVERTEITSHQLLELKNSISWDSELRNVVYSLQSSEGSSVFRTRIDGFTLKVFDVPGQRVTKPFFVNSNIIGFYNFDRKQVVIKDLDNDNDILIHSLSPNQSLDDLSWSHSKSRLILNINNDGESENDILYYLIETSDNGSSISQPFLLVNNGYRAYSK
jgi:hypothetical protein